MKKLEEFIHSELFDIIYFDAFAPSRQPEVWSLTNLQKCYSLLKEDGILVTYCAQGQFKRDLIQAGFNIEIDKEQYKVIKEFDVVVVL